MVRQQAVYADDEKDEEDRLVICENEGTLKSPMINILERILCAQCITNILERLLCAQCITHWKVRQGDETDMNYKLIIIKTLP